MLGLSVALPKVLGFGVEKFLEEAASDPRKEFLEMMEGVTTSSSSSDEDSSELESFAVETDLCLFNSALIDVLACSRSRGMIRTPVQR